MTINKVAYEQLFPLPQPYSNVRLSMEITIQEGDSIPDAFTKAQTIVNENFNKLFPQQPVATENGGLLYIPNGITQPIPEVQYQKKTGVESLIPDIERCKSIKELNTWKLLVNKNPELQSAFNKRMEELSNGHT